MLTDKEIQVLMIRYPDGVNKEIFRKVCHVSPRMAQYLLESQLVPCTIKDQKSHKYSIRTVDMVTYLRDREKHPERYCFPSQRDKCAQDQKTKRRKAHGWLSEAQLRAITDEAYEEACQNVLATCPDVMTVDHASHVIGYSYKTYVRWYREKKLTCIVIRTRLLVPKLALYEFMLSGDFRGRKRKSELHWQLLKEAAKIAKRGLNADDAAQG